jgi:protein-S-isoprenylcysteine O-methyltransferase Ste14
VIQHYAVVLRQELNLEQKLGDAYRRYRQRVPRNFVGK